MEAAGLRRRQMEERIFILDKDTFGIFSELYTGLVDSATLLSDGRIALGVMYDEQPAGLLIATVSDEAAWVDWLYIKEDYRNNGIGTALLWHFLNSVAKFTSCDEVKTACSDKSVRRFFSGQGFLFDRFKTSARYEANIRDFKDMDVEDGASCIVPVASLTRKMQSIINRAFMEDPELQVGIKLPIVPEDYYPGSAAYFSEDKLEAALFLKEDEKGVSVAYAYMSPGSPKSLVSLMAYAKNKVIELRGESAVVSAVALNSSSKKLTEKIFPKAEKTVCYTGTLDMFPVRYSMM